MDSTFPTTAIILNRYDWREADRLVSVYTKEYGRLTLLSRGARKLNSKLAAHLEPINLSRLLVVKGKGFDYVGAALIEEPFLGIKQDLNKLYFAGQALFHFNSLVREGAADPVLFSWLEKWLYNLDIAEGEKEMNKDDGRFRLALFLWRLFELLGHGPQLNLCVACGQPISPGKNYFDFARGGLICPSCRSKKSDFVSGNDVLPISDNCIKLLRLASGGSWQNLKFSPKLLREWENINRLFSAWLIS